MFYSHKDVQTLCNKVNNELKEVCNYSSRQISCLQMQKNKTKQNKTKTKTKNKIKQNKTLIFLGARFQTNKINKNYEIYLDGCKLARVEVKASQ